MVLLGGGSQEVSARLGHTADVHALDVVEEREVPLQGSGRHGAGNQGQAGEQGLQQEVAEGRR